MIVCPATIAKVTYFNLNVFIDKRASVVVFNLYSLIGSSSLFPLVFIMLSLNAFLDLVFLDKVLLNLGAEISII
jgi:hypothetical protein